jgi:hypothetical protein
MRNAPARLAGLQQSFVHARKSFDAIGLPAQT